MQYKPGTEPKSGAGAVRSFLRSVRNTTTREAETGAEALASAPLTIDTGSLRDLWLPIEKSEAESVQLLHVMAFREVRKPVIYSALSRGCVALQKEHRETVEEIRERGGLLLIGGAA